MNTEKIVEYRTAFARDLDEFDAAVNDSIAKGFQPFGSPYITSGDQGDDICQAMVKRGNPGQQE